LHGAEIALILPVDRWSWRSSRIWEERGLDVDRNTEREGRGEATVRTFSGGAFAQNGYLVVCAGTQRGILVDPGGGVEGMVAVVQQEGIEVESIVLTHAHLDHVDGVARAKRETRAPILMHADDEPVYRSAVSQAEWFGVRIDPPPPVDQHLSDGATVRFGDCELRVLHTPGHSPGHVILVGDGYALVGDCVFAGSIGRTDLPGGDFQLLMKSIRTHILTLPDETILYSGHGPATTVGHEKVSNPFLVPDFGGRGFA
jgi:hydroxyacylglutathione hydrolase